MRPAILAYLFAVMMLSLCEEYWQIMLVQGIFMGSIMGLLQFPAFAAVSQYFDKKRAAALGIVISGSSVGGIVIPILLSKLLNGTTLGFGWSVRVVGFLMVPFLCFASFTVRPRLPSRTTTFWIGAAYNNRKFVLLIIALFFILAGMFTPLFFIPTYAVSRGMSPALAGYLLAIVNAASTFGRIIPAMLADKYGRLNAFALGALATGIIIFCMNVATTNTALIIYSISFGFWSGTIISGAATAFSVCTRDVREVGTYLGMGMSISALGGLIGPPLNGQLIARFGGFFEASMFSGALCVFGGVIAVLTKLATSEGLLGKV